MRALVLGLLAMISCNRDATIKSEAVDLQNSKPDLLTIAEKTIVRDQLNELVQRVRAKRGPEFLDELIQRTGGVTLNKFYERPDYYFGYPLAIQGRIAAMQHIQGGHVFHLVVPAKIDIIVMGEQDIDFSNDEEVDVVGYFGGFNKAECFMVWSHSVLRKGAIAHRRKELKILNRLMTED
jgi:hypothetical protein